MKPFDDKFADNVREVFDNWDEPVDEQAWMQMKNRLQKPSKTRFIALIPFGLRAAAAVLVLMVVTASLWQIFFRMDSASLVVVSEQADSNLTAVETPHITRNELSEQTTESLANQEIFVSYAEPEGSSTPPLSTEPAIADMQQQTVLETVAIAPDSIESQQYHETTVHTAEIPSLQEAITFKDEGLVEQTQSLAETFPTPEEEEKIIRENLARIQAEKSTTHNPMVELAAGSMKTYSSDELAGGVGFSAGITRDWPVGKKFSLSGGGILVYNQFNLNNNPGYINNSGDFHYSDLPNFEQSDNVNVISQNTSTDFEFMAIDIPVNIRYRISDFANRQIYISAGLSSFLYLQQSYSNETEMLADMRTYDALGNYSIQRNYSNVTNSGEMAPFQRFDFARFINLSAGYVIKRNNHAMVIEPYVKLPLGTITSLNLNIGMAGLTLRYRIDARP